MSIATVSGLKAFEASLSTFNRLAVPLEMILDCDSTVEDVRSGLETTISELMDRIEAGDYQFVQAHAEIKSLFAMPVVGTSVAFVPYKQSGYGSAIFGSKRVETVTSVEDVHRTVVHARNAMLTAFGL